MLIKVALGFKGEATGYARVRPLSRVRADVLLQDTGLRTGSATVVADVFSGFFGLLLLFAVAFLCGLRARLRVFIKRAW